VSLLYGKERRLYSGFLPKNIDELVQQLDGAKWQEMDGNNMKTPTGHLLPKSR